MSCPRWSTVHPATGAPIAADVLRHNAYTLGWEHGAADYVPPTAELPTGIYRDLYWRGHEDGHAARAVAWTIAAAVRGGGE